MEALLDSLLGPYLDQATIRQNAEAMQRPPLTTTLRINTLAVGDGSTCPTQLAKNLLPEFTPSPLNDEVISVPACGPFAIVPAAKQVIVSLGCAQAVLRGAHVFAVGVLAIQDVAAPDERNVSVWADLDGRCTRGLRREYTGRKRFLGNGLLMLERDVFFKAGGCPKGVGVQMTETEWRLPSFEALPPHIFFPQNLPSILAVAALAPQPGETILDMCASPGGKTSHIAARMKNTGVLVALDRSAAKVAVLEENLARLGVACVHARVADSTKLCNADDPTLSALGFGVGAFDRILLDPPCSGIGQRPCLVPSAAASTAGALQGYAPYQRRLLAVAARLLRPNGMLVYSTCTISPDENEGNVAWALQHTGLRLHQMECKYGSAGLAVSPDFPADCVRRFWPASADDTIAFFIAAFTK